MRLEAGVTSGGFILVLLRQRLAPQVYTPPDRMKQAADGLKARTVLSSNGEQFFTANL
jgi:hypothetical protein